VPLGWLLLIVDLTVLGLPTPASAPSAAARAANREGLVAHRFGDEAKARALFERAVQASPAEGLYRFNLACAEAKMGLLAEASHELARLLREDLPSFAPRLRRDPDLDALRTSTRGRELEQAAAELDDAWPKVARSGVPALLLVVDARPPSGVIQTSLLRAGVYLAQSGRFLPTAPIVPRASGALVDLDRDRTIVATLDFSDCKSDFCPRLLTVDVFEYALPGSHDPAGTWHHRVSDIGDGAELHSDAASGWARTDDCSFARCKSPWYRLQDQSQGVPQLEGPHAWLHARGGAVSRAPKGVRVLSRVLVTPKGRVKLDARHARAQNHDVVPLSETTLLVVSSADSCECGAREGPLFEYTISLVDMTHKTARVVRSGSGFAAAAIDSSGALYVQIGPQVTRYARAFDFGPQAIGQPLPAGVVLTIGSTGDGNCCGL
jgi:hypothetical protein